MDAAETSAADIRRKNRRTLRWLGVLAVGMFGFGFALVPLYGLLCEVTGIGSLEQRAALATQAGDSAAGVVQERWITVKFDGTVHPDLPWAFEPLERRIRVHPGQTYEVRFMAENRSSRPVTGQALPNIAPWQANAFFSKLECFCFRQQTLQGGERVEMPLRFMVSPDLPDEHASLTLSYNFFRVADGDAVAVAK